MRSSQVGLFIGAILGLALVLKGFGEMLVVALVALTGWVVARVLEGEIDLAEVLGSRRGRKTSQR